MSKDAIVLVIVPAYNEEDSIERIIQEIRGKAPFVDVLIVDDGSEDRTAKIVKKCEVLLISHPYNLGIGGAVQTGLKYAKLDNYDIAVQVDGDGQHDPMYIRSLIEPLVNGKADIVIGSRYIQNTNGNAVPFTRDVGIRFFSWLTSKIIGKKITDCTSGFRALNRHAIEVFAENYPIDFPDAEALILAHKTGLKIVEIPTKFRSRKHGKSSLFFWRFLYYPFKEMISIFNLLTKKVREPNE